MRSRGPDGPSVIGPQSSRFHLAHVVPMTADNPRNSRVIGSLYDGALPTLKLHSPRRKRECFAQPYADNMGIDVFGANIRVSKLMSIPFSNSYPAETWTR